MDDHQIALPDLDVGQFNALTDLNASQRRMCTDVMNVARYILRGSTMRDACILVGVSPSSASYYLRMWRKEEREEHVEVKPTPYTLALGYTLARAMSIRALRWQTVAEAGGRESNTARWMLERRVRGEYSPPVQKTQRESTQRVEVSVTEIGAQLEETRKALGVSEKDLATMGEYWAQVSTAAQRGKELPPPPVKSADPKQYDS